MMPKGIPPLVFDEIEHRTPGFIGWQESKWLFHCSDGCDFLGMFGRDELAGNERMQAAVADSIREWGWSDAGVRAFMERLDRDQPPTAYVFRCLHCAAYRAYCDFT
jgi:uncharacterized protein CbrC (UPF0167 family)